MENNSRKRKSTTKKTEVDTTKKHSKHNTNRTSTRTRRVVTKRTDTRNDTSAEAYLNYSRLLQLFPYLHPVAIDHIFASCNRDFVRTIDNLLYIKRYVYFVQINGYQPHTDPNVVVHQDIATENNHRTNTDGTSLTEMHDENNVSNADVDGDGYIPNGNIEGIRQQIHTYEEQRNHPTEYEYNSPLNSEVNFFGGPGYNFYTSTPQTAEPSAANMHDEMRYLQLGN